jgi:peroxiredoxin
VQLQQVHSTLIAQQVALFAISYDSVATLSQFADKHAIGYPLLSDQGSHVMRALGLINDHVGEDHAFYGIAASARHVGLPYPGIFVLDRHGLIVHKQFHESYRVRDTGAGALTQLLGLTPARRGADDSAALDGVQVRAWLDSPTYSWFQRLKLTVELVVESGLHVYGHPAPDGCMPISGTVDPIDGLDVGPVEWPRPGRLKIQGLTDELAVHEGTIHGSVPLVFSGAPGAGDRVVRVTVRFQPCSGSWCLPPRSVDLELPVREIALVDRVLPTVRS